MECPSRSNYGKLKANDTWGVDKGYEEWSTGYSKKAPKFPSCSPATLPLGQSHGKRQTELGSWARSQRSDCRDWVPSVKRREWAMTAAIGPQLMCGEGEGGNSKHLQRFQGHWCPPETDKVNSRPRGRKKKRKLGKHLFASMGCFSGICKQRQIKSITQYIYMKYSQREGEQGHFWWLTQTTLCFYCAQDFSKCVTVASQCKSQ